MKVSDGRTTTGASFYLGLVLVVAASVAIGLVLLGQPPVVAGSAGLGADPRPTLWGARALDVLGQGAIIFVAALGVLVLFGSGGDR